MPDVIYILFDGTSCDGRGEGDFLKRTLDKKEAIKHFKKIEKNPYSVGKVMVLTETGLKIIYNISGFEQYA